MGARLSKHWRLAPFLAFLGLGLARAQDVPFKTTIDHVCGVNTYQSPNAIKDCEAQSAQNLVFDQGVPAQIREGLVTYFQTGTSAPVRGLWPYRATDGTDWVVGIASGTLFGYNGTSTSTILSGLDFDNRMDCASCLAKLYCVNRSTSLFSFDGSTIAYSTHAPVASFVECWRNRIVLGDVSGSQSTLYLSGELDPDAYTPATQSTSPLTWRIGGVDDAGNRIRCMRAGFGDFLFLGTPGRTYGFFGHDTRDFHLDEIFSNVGCLDDGTVQEHLGELTWVSPDGVERFDRNVLRYPRVSEPIKDVTDQLIASAASEFSWTQTSQTDFQAGVSTQTSPNISAGSVVLSTSSDIDNDGTDFGAGTTSNTSVLSQRVYLSTSNTNVDNNDFETASGADLASWAETSVFPYTTCKYNGAQSAEFLGGSSPSDTMYADILDTSGSTLQTTTLGAYSAFSDCAFTEKTITQSSYVGRWIKLRFRYASTSLTSDPFLSSGGQISVRVGRVATAFGLYSMLVDYVIGGRSDVYSGTFTSSAFDTGFSSAAFVATTASWTTNGHSITVQTQESATGVGGWSTAVSWSTGSAPTTSTWQRYKRYVLTLSTGGTTNGTALPYVDSVALGARAATGTFISQGKDVTGVTAWGNFESNQTPTNGTLTYYVRSAANVAGLNAATWVAQTPFATVAAAVNNAIQYKIEFAMTASDGDPSHQDATVFWRTGASAPPMASIVFKDRYHLFYTTSTAEGAYNDSVAPLDRLSQWTFFTGVNAASAARYKNLLLYGDAASTGKVYRLYSGYNDNGAAIPVRLYLKDFDNGNPDAQKKFSTLYVTAGHETEDSQDVDISMTYTVNDSTHSYSLGSFNLGENVGRINARMPFPKDQGLMLKGRWLSPRLSGSVLDSPFTLFGINIYGQQEDVK